MKKEEVLQTYKDCVLATYTKLPLVFVKGKGSRLWDIHDKEYLDFFPGWGVGGLGHCHPKVVSAIRDQAPRLIFVANNFYNLPQAKLAQEIINRSFPGKVFFCNSGAEANEGAIKLARKFGKGRYEVITFDNSFHGRTLAAITATGQKKYQEGFHPLPEGFKHVPFNDLAALSHAVTDKTAAVMLELIQGEGGIHMAGKDFVQGLRKLCDEKKLLLIVDEVQTGIGRTGKFFCYQNYGITPDVMTLAKALGGGMPIGVMVVKNEFADVLGPGTHASTFGGSPLVCRAALAVLKAVQKEKLLANTQKMGTYLAAKLSALKERYPVIKEVRGMGLMIGVDLHQPGKAVVERCLEQGLLINCTHDTVLRIMPALTVTKGQIDKALIILERAIATLTG